MNKFACQYKIVRFAPFLETEEFANIGVLVFCPAKSQLEFLLAPSRFGRVTQFFHNMDKRVYKTVIKTLEAEFERAKKLVEKNNSELGKAIFAELSRPKGGVVLFSDTRVLLTENIAQETERLFNHFVGRSFNTRDYREKYLEKNLRQTLKRINLDRVYKKATLKTDLMEITLPFVRADGISEKRAIKPLAFDQSTIGNAVKHADLWLSQAEHIIEADVSAEDLLFMLDLESVADKGLERYLRKFQGKLSHLGIETTNAKDENSIIEFARKH